MEKSGNDKELASIIFHSVLATMKNTLNLEELSYRESGRQDPRYKTFKKHLMEFTYNSLEDLFEDLKEWGLVEETEYDEYVKNGYQDTRSGGSGYLNSAPLNELLKN